MGNVQKIKKKKIPPISARLHSDHECLNRIKLCYSKLSKNNSKIMHIFSHLKCYLALYFCSIVCF